MEQAFRALLPLRWPQSLKFAVVALVVALLSVIGYLQLPGFPQSQDEVSTNTGQAAVVLDGRELFTVRDLPSFTAAERANFANQVLQNQVKRFPLDVPIVVNPLKRGDLMTLRVGGRHFLTLTDQDLIGGITSEEQAELWATRLQEALDQAQYERTADYRQNATANIFAVGLSLVIVSLLARWCRRQLRRRRKQRAGRPIVWLETGLLVVPWFVWFGFVVWVSGLFPQVRSWRYQAAEFLAGTLSAPLVELGGEGYSILELGRILVLVLLLWLAVKALTSLIRSRFLQSIGAERTVQDAIALLIQISLTTLGLLVLLQAVGVDISSLAILASIIGVGIGFGLQNIANNFISGLIIMLERPIQVGDFVKLGDLTGTVERIGIRSTQISTLDLITIIVPNSEFIDGKVINWSHGHPVSRLHLPLSVAYGSPIQRVRQATLEAADSHPRVLRYPKPQLWFEGFGDSSLDFNLLVWVREPRQQFRIKSDLYYLLEASLRRHQIRIPFPQRDVHVRGEDLSAFQQQLSSREEELLSASDSLPVRPDKWTTLMDSQDWSEILELTDAPTSTEIQELVAQMRGQSGVDIQDRRFGLRIYRSCFVGSEAVNWLVQNQMASREEAIRLGQLLVEQCIIHHVTDEHDFKDEYLFYRFFEDESQANK